MSVEEYATEGAFIVGRMAQLGYRPVNSFGQGQVVFEKDYADDAAGFARVAVFFDRPVAGIGDLRLANIVVTTQKAFEPTLAAVTACTPGTAHGDLTQVLETFAAFIGRVPDQAAPAAVRPCLVCSTPSAAFYVINGDAICYGCVAARKAGHG